MYIRAHLLNYCLIACVLAIALPVYASNSSSSWINLQRIGAEWRLETKQVDLAAILDAISDKTGVPIHYSVLPPSLVSASCLGVSVKALLACLLGDKLDVVFRGAESAQGNPGRTSLEVWLLGSSLAKTNGDICGLNTPDKSIPSLTEQDSAGTSEPSPEDKLAFRKQMAVSGGPQVRAQAIAYLAAHASANDKDVQEILSAALIDENTEIRGQALASLVAREGEAAALPELQKALQANEVSMRIMALQLVTDERLIAESLSDENANVRQFASLKLQAK